MVQTKKKERKELEDYEPGAPRGEMFNALAKASRTINGKESAHKAMNKPSATEKNWWKRPLNILLG